MDSLQRRDNPTADAREIVDLARDLVRGDVPRDEAAAKLAAVVGHRQPLDAAHRLWVQRMHELPTDDFEATDVLRVLLAALALVPNDRPPVVRRAGEVDG